MIVETLQVLLPPELSFLITDRGTHFTANAFKKLVLSEEFIHFLIAQHRPQSNGIAERFVRTLKEWLEDKSWQNDQELAALLQQLLDEYNDRPHQGSAIPGLSPNELAKRIWLISSLVNVQNIADHYTPSEIRAGFLQIGVSWRL